MKANKSQYIDLMVKKLSQRAVGCAEQSEADAVPIVIKSYRTTANVSNKATSPAQLLKQQSLDARPN